ncbi:helix-turn-helix domain-containing protein [Polynucleobacter paneuropaeus]|uniref:helix-turn-helix domain-containing protein n=1 Tax=Polynucleobacter paneuropaeus TaxID=2527775 RepID=UPI001BFE3EDA|nr:helix-turn-helix domain-containing protein [Polynucleobacter paneuropaeus]QWD49857.1 helix-turn-helix domain-containing protein [Polynucleobacter paneuropaeus]
MKVKNTIPEIRKEVFVKAREALGLSVQELSGKACLSVRQIQQIENGEHNSFYSPNIKFTAAKKVAQLLDLQTEEAFDFGDLVSQLPVEVQEAKPSPAVVEEKPKTKTPEPASNIKVESAALAKSIQQKKPASSSPDKKPWLPILAFIAIAGFAFLSLRPSLFGTASETAQAPAEEVKAEAPVPPAEPSAQAALEKAAEPAPSPTPTPAAVVAPVAVAPTPTATATECPMADSNVASYKTDAPKKSADMVYLVAKTPQVVCVLDATGKSQSKQLEPGIGASVYGKAPLKVLTAGLSQVDLYFQGVKVRPGNAGNTILLEPAPLSANKNDSDSELR